jgi:hypothetical protein
VGQAACRPVSQYMSTDAFWSARPDRGSDAGVVFSAYQTINQRQELVVRVRRPGFPHKMIHIVSLQLSLQRHLQNMLFYHKGLGVRKTPLPLIAGARKAAILRGHMWSAHEGDVVGIITQANRYLGGFCSSQRIFPPQIIQVLLSNVLP